MLMRQPAPISKLAAVVLVAALTLIGVCAASCDDRKVCDPKSSQACYR